MAGIREAFAPVADLDDLERLDINEIVDGYMDWRPGDPEPGANRGRAYWHGWMNCARDHGEKPHTAESRKLAHDLCARGASRPRQ